MTEPNTPTLAGARTQSDQEWLEETIEQAKPTPEQARALLAGLDDDAREDRRQEAIDRYIARKLQATIDGQNIKHLSARVEEAIRAR